MPIHEERAAIELDPLLGKRLRCIADAVLPGEPVADLCCDHAWLSIALVRAGRVPRAIAGDVHPGPIARTNQVLAQLSLADRISLRHGDGLDVLEPGEVASVVIAGVGAPLAARLLERGHASGRLVGVRRVIVQANDVFPRLGELRARLAALGWGLVDERLVHEHQRFYVVLIAEPLPAGSPLRDAIDRELGPRLRRGEDPLFVSWLAHERARVAAVLEGMQRGAPDPEHRARFAWWLEQLIAHSGGSSGSGS